MFSIVKVFYNDKENELCLKVPKYDSITLKDNYSLTDIVGELGELGYDIKTGFSDLNMGSVEIYMSKSCENVITERDFLTDRLEEFFIASNSYGEDNELNDSENNDINYGDMLEKNEKEKSGFMNKFFN